MHKDISTLCQTCIECQKTAKRCQVKAPLMPLPVISQPFSRMAMDIVGPLPRTKHGNKFILTLMDFTTRYPEAVPLRLIDAKSIATALVEIFSRHGIPSEILTDRGTNFTSSLMAELFAMLRIDHTRHRPTIPRQMGWLSALMEHCNTF